MTLPPILQRWLDLQTTIGQFHNRTHVRYHNVNEAIQHTRLLFEHIAQHSKPIQDWLDVYLAEHRTEICLRYWLESGHEYCMQYLEHGHAYTPMHARRQEWDTLFQGPTFRSYDVGWEQALQIVQRARRNMDVEICRDEAILAIHKDKPCVSNGWYCDLCDDMEHAWKRAVKQQVLQSKHVLLNKSLHEEFLTRAIQSEVVQRIKKDWEFPIVYEPNVETLEGIQKCVQERRSVYAKQGKTPYQACTEFLSILAHSTTGCWISQSHLQTDWEVFQHLMCRLPVIHHAIPIDLQRCKEIEDMF
jgi:hypothetical protein